MNHDLRPIVPAQVSQDPQLVAPYVRDRFSTAATLRAQIYRCAIALRRRWWVLLLCVLFIAGPVTFYAIIRPATFHSQAIMWLTGKLNLPGEGLYAEDLTSYIATQAELIKSSTIQSRALEKIRARFPGIAGAKTNTATFHFPFAITVRSSLKNSVLVVGATGPSPEATKAFLDAVMDEYLALKKDSRKRNSSLALSSITDQINDVENQIQQQQKQLTLFQMSNNISYLTEHGLSSGSYLAKLAEVLSDLRTGHRLLELLTPAEFKGLSEGPQVAMSDTAVPGEGRESLAQAWNTAAPQSAYYQGLQQIEVLKAKRDEFSRVLRPTHSKMVKLNQEIAGLTQLIKTLQDEGEKRAAAQMANRKKFLELQIQNIEGQYNAWETNAAEASRKLTEYDRMKQDLQRTQALFDRLSGLLQAVDLNHSLGQEPLVPLEPASLGSPTLTKYGIVAAGLFLALLVGGGTFVLLENLDDRFSSSREVTLHLPTEVLGQIPDARFSVPDGALQSLPVADIQSAFAESFRNLRSSLLFMSEQNIQPKVILVTSAIPKEGKTTVASNLARTLAMSGSRVLLVDADIRRSSIHQIFGVCLKPGLLEVLSQAVPPAQAIVLTTQPGLFVLPAGDSGNISSDAFLRNRIDLLLRDLATQYNYIVIDTAPVLATDDAVCLGRHTDGVFMVVRASYTSARMVRDALDRLRIRQIKILGTVYNFAPPSADYYSRYSRDYQVSAQ